ncbi:MAG: peptidoglycan endopeptidase [Pseudomonadota bacterium]
MRTDYAERARALVGTRFRPQGRGEHGLDCIGLVMAVFEIPMDAAPRDYRLRSGRGDELQAGLARHFRKVRKVEAGDVLLLEVASDQPHLAVRTSAGFVHAHAGIGRVVETPGLPEWPLLGAYRKRKGG